VRERRQTSLEMKCRKCRTWRCGFKISDDKDHCPNCGMPRGPTRRILTFLRLAQKCPNLRQAEREAWPTIDSVRDELAKLTTLEGDLTGLEQESSTRLGASRRSRWRRSKQACTTWSGRRPCIAVPDGRGCAAHMTAFWQKGTGEKPRKMDHRDVLEEEARRVGMVRARSGWTLYRLEGMSDVVREALNAVDRLGVASREAVASV